MGGIGSGRVGRRPVAEQSLALPINIIAAAVREVAAAGPSASSYPQTVVWSRWGEPVASLGYTVFCRAGGPILVRLRYQAQAEPVDELIGLASSVPNYGGHRWWWICPSCSRRVGVLYNAGGVSWRCRHCYRVTYRSANASDKRLATIRLYPGWEDDVTRMALGQVRLLLKAADRLLSQQARAQRRAVKAARQGRPGRPRTRRV